MNYMLNETCRFICGVTSFGLPAGAIVTVKPYDQVNNKILIDFSGGLIDWFHISVLEKLAPTAEGETGNPTTVLTGENK